VGLREIVDADRVHVGSTGEDAMKAKIGDRLVLAGTHVGNDRRTGTIIEIEHADGTPPYRVRWPDGHESFISPGPDARIEPRESGTDDR
jgi:Domain of unknown function (DUF1918)